MCGVCKTAGGERGEEVGGERGAKRWGGERGEEVEVLIAESRPQALCISL